MYPYNSNFNNEEDMTAEVFKESNQKNNDHPLFLHTEQKRPPTGGGFNPSQPFFPPNSNFPPQGNLPPQGNQPPMGKPPHQKPPGEPPAFTPKESPGLRAVDPGAIRNCLFNYTYIWFTNGRGFWMYPTFVGRTSISGYRWGRFGWSYVGFDLDMIRSFYCAS